MLVIADDQGLDSSAQYSLSQDLPNTPITDSLAAKGLIFDNAWAPPPSCTTTRGSIITGLHGVNSGVQRTPSLLDTELLTVQKHLKNAGSSVNYASAVIGKWHLAGGNSQNLTHSIESGVDYYAGTIEGVIDDYYSWPLTANGATETSTVYHTTAMTDLAIDWVAAQNSPWFLWLAYIAPHERFHAPPSALHTRNLSGEATDIQTNPRQYYLAAIEAMDTEIGRLLASIPTETLDNTLIVFIGDNGTPRQVIDLASYPRSHSKGTLYEGGIRVPMVVSGAGVTRFNEREPALVNTVDLFATFAAVAQLPEPENLDSQSFLPLLSESGASTRLFNYSEYVSVTASGWMVRDNSLKLIEYADSSRELYDLSVDSREENNLIGQANSYAEQIIALEVFANQVRTL